MSVPDRELITPNAPFHYAERHYISWDTDLRKLHIHDEIELVRVCRGQVLCEVGSDRFVLKEGTILLINTKVSHQISFYQSDAEIEYIQINIQPRVNTILPAGNTYLHLFMNRTFKKPYELYHGSSELHLIFNKIIAEHIRKEPCFRMAIGAYIDLIIAHMARNQMLIDLNIPAETSAYSQLTPAIEFVERNFQSKVSLEDVCAAVHINKYYFCKIFKRATGATLMEYVNFRRLLYAEAMLLHTNKNVNQIALESGFASNQYFTKVFKNNYVLSPSAYRKHYSRASFNNIKNEAPHLD